MNGLAKATRRLGIRGKMLLGFAAVIGLVGVGNLYGLVSIGRVTGEAVSGGTAALRKVLLVTEVESQVRRMVNAAATPAPEAHAQAGSLRREAGRRIAEARTSFKEDKRLCADLEELDRGLEDHLRRSSELSAPTAERDWSALGPVIQEFQGSQGALLRRVAEIRERCVREMEDSQDALALRTLRTHLNVTAVTGLALVAAVLIALHLSGEVVRPIRRLTDLMGDAQAGDFSLRADVDTVDETGSLSRGFNELLEHLERRDEELALHRNHLEELAQERTAQLAVANRRLESELEFRNFTEKALAESEQNLRRVLDSVRAGIVIVDADRREVLDANAFALELMGAARQDVVGRRCLGAVCPDGDPCPLTLEEHTLENAECQLQRADGWRVPILKSVVPITDGGRARLIESFIDLSEVKRHENALRESEQRYRTLFASAQDAIFILDTRPGAPVRIVDLNAAAARMHGYDVEDLRGHSLAELEGEDLLAEGRGEAIREGEWVSVEVNQKHRDGRKIPVQVTAGPLDFGEARYVLAFGRDVTEQKAAREELEAFNERLKRSNQDLEEFAYVASHDLQEPLRKVQAFGDRLRDRHGEGLGDQGRDYLDRMQNAARRMQQLIEGLLTFSRVTTQARPFGAVDLGQVAREVLSDLEVRIEQSGARVDVGPLPTIDADPLQMRQLLQNLVGNALKFRRPGEPPVVRIRGELAPDGADSARVLQARVTVEDEGIGFDPKYAERIFGVFQRLQGRGEYEGTGVGLAVCRKIVERHGGSIAAHGVPGSGARFVVTLPARRAAG